MTCSSFGCDHIMSFFARTINPVDAIYGIIKEMAGDANSVKYVLLFMFRNTKVLSQLK